MVFFRFEGNPVGGSPTASHFSCFAKKSNPKKATPDPPPLMGFPALLVKPGDCATRPSVSHKPCHAAELKQCSSTSPALPALLGGGYGDGNSKSKAVTPRAPCARLVCIETKVWALMRPHCASGFDFAFWVLTLCPFWIAEGEESNWEEGEHCLSSAAAHVVCGWLGRVAQPPNLIVRPKEPAGRYGRVAFSLVTLFWRSKRK